MRRKSREEIRKTAESFRYRKLLFAFSAFSQIVNLLLLAILNNELSEKLIYIMICMCLLAILICCDKRKTHVDWPYIFIVSAIYFGVTAFVVFRSCIYWCLWILVPEILLFVILALILYKTYSANKN